MCKTKAVKSLLSSLFLKCRVNLSPKDYDKKFCGPDFITFWVPYAGQWSDVVQAFLNSWKVQDGGHEHVRLWFITEINRHEIIKYNF